jgi:hypothetical protein
MAAKASHATKRCCAERFNTLTNPDAQKPGAGSNHDDSKWQKRHAALCIRAWRTHDGRCFDPVQA